MALRDYLNFESTADFADFTLVNGQAVAIVTMDGITPLETWYYNASSMAVPNGTTVFKPNAINIANPGRYLKNMTASDWNTTINKPIFADVALSGDYNDLDNKLTAGIGILINSNEIQVDDTQFMSISEANTALTDMQAEIATKAPQVRTITINGITQDLEANRDWEVGNVSTSGSYNNPSWITGLAYSKLTGTPTIPTNTNQLTNGAGFITGYTETDPTVPSYSKSLTAFSVIKSSTDPLYKAISYVPSWTEITSKPSFSTVATSGSYNDLTNKPIIPTLVSQLTNDSAFINQSGGRTAVSLTTTGISGASTYNSSTGVFNIPNYTYTPVARVFNNNVARTLNSNYTISTTRDASVTYSVSLSVTNPLITGASTASAFLEYSTNAGSSWTTVSQVVNSSSVAVAVAIAITQPNTFVLSGEIPANALVRLRTTTSGTASATYTLGSETLL